MPRFVRYNDGNAACGYEPPVKRSRDSCQDSLVRDALAVVCNPWENVQNPKFPDGKATFSVGKRHAVAEEVRVFNPVSGDRQHVPSGLTNPDLHRDIVTDINLMTHKEGTINRSGRETVLIALFAGINNHCVAVKHFDDIKREYNADPPVATATNEEHLQLKRGYQGMGNLVLSNHYARSGIAFESRFPHLQVGAELPDNALSPFEQRTVFLHPTETSAVYSHWRPVSVGLRIKSLNNETDDGGWFEAIRTSTNVLTDRPHGPHGEFGRPFGVAIQTHNPPRYPMGPIGAAAEWPNTGTNSMVEPLNGVQNQSTKVANGNLIPFPEFTAAHSYEEASDWGGNKSYCQGKLTDLACMEFQLNCIRRDNDFKRIRSAQFYDAEWTFFAEGGTEPKWVRFMNLVTPYRAEFSVKINAAAMWGLGEWFDNATDQNVTYDTNRGRMIQRAHHHQHPDTQSDPTDLFSDAFDVILIRIHGNNSKTKLFLESICNREYLLKATATGAAAFLEWQSPAFMDTKSLYEIIDYRNDRYLRPCQRLRKL